MNYLELAEQVIKQVNQPLTPNEIWEKAVELGLDQKLNSIGKTPWATITARLYVDVRDNPNTKFEIVGKRPTRFGLKGITQNSTNTILEQYQILKPESFTERDLHPLLVKFADTYHHFRGMKIKTIFHENSSKTKRGYNKWLHPDLVGVYFSFNDPIRQYEKVIIEFQNDFSISSIKLFSFELKIKLDISNLREAYFQAVSNSSWANEGYLVTLKIDEEVIEEVRRLTNSFGIGLIKLDAENIEESQIIVPATYKKQLDIDAMDRLATENQHFRDFLQNIIDDNKIKKVNSKYDEVLSNEELARYLKDKGIIK
ncbi:MAG: HTH domain-containing protein [Bacteroidia bacterium]|nr:HTH domain-containing protein [Bacteroidia bacterium]MDW8301022.1 HTH domain-containing protein [Bacteroidia bacterium]